MPYSHQPPWLLRYLAIPCLTPWRLKQTTSLIYFQQQHCSQRNQEPNVCHGTKGCSPNDNLEKLTRNALKLAPLKEKQYWNCNHYWFDEKRELWLEPNNNPLLPESLYPHYCACIELLVTDKIITVMNQYWCGNVHKATKSIYFSCPTCPRNNPEETVHTTPRHFKLPNGSFKVWQMDLIHLYPSHGYKYVSEKICVFPMGKICGNSPNTLAESIAIGASKSQIHPL